MVLQGFPIVVLHHQVQGGEHVPVVEAVNVALNAAVVERLLKPLDASMHDATTVDNAQGKLAGLTRFPDEKGAISLAAKGSDGILAVEVLRVPKAAERLAKYVLNHFVVAGRV